MNPKLLCCIAVMTSSFLASPASASPAPVAYKSGAWSVEQKIDTMTDKRVCTAYLTEDPEVQANPKNFFVSFRERGGIESYNLRIGDAPAKGKQIATRLEQKVGAVILGPLVKEAYAAKRLRLQVKTLLGDLLTEDIDLTGFRESLDYIRDNCKK